MGEIRALRNAKGATIEGGVTQETSAGPTAAGGVSVTVLGPDGSQASTTDQRGMFEVPVKAGRYRFAPGDLIPTDYSRKDVQGFDLAPGQCAQFQLSTRRP
jgi:predicted amidohydrolase